MSDTNLSPYEAIGGEATLRPLVEAFYDRVAQHPNLRPLFPEDFTEVKERQLLFLTQFLGGPALYSQKHGPAMMRARHLRFPIDQERAQDWLSCMRGAMADINMPEPARDWLLQRLSQTAAHFVNQ